MRKAESDNAKLFHEIAPKEMPIEYRIYQLAKISLKSGLSLETLLNQNSYYNDIILRVT